MTDYIIDVASKWKDYELIDSGNKHRLERFGKYILFRPDPQAIWKPRLSMDVWQKCDALFDQKSEGKGNWVLKSKLPNKWTVNYKDISFYAKLSPFKHTGVFPEQSVNWDFMTRSINNKSNVNILNLFAYTGGSTLACAKAGAKVTHLDASKPSISWARENQILSGLQDKPIRWIPDDAIKFTSREIKRGVKYDGIVLDPPVYGHGPNGERWDFYKDMPKLLDHCVQLLSSSPLFVIINAYAISSSALMLKNLMGGFFDKGTIDVGELAIQEQNQGRLLSTGIFLRWYP